MKGSRVQISDSAPGGVREKERITPTTAKSLMCQRHVRLFRFQASGESNGAQASASRPAHPFRPRKRPEMNPGRRDLRQAAGIKFDRRVFFFIFFSIPLLRNGSPNEAPGPGRLKGNAVKIGNSSLCCKFLPPKRHNQTPTISCHWFSRDREGVGTGTSQKTCRCNGFTIQGEMDRDRQEKRFPAYPRM